MAAPDAIGGAVHVDLGPALAKIKLALSCYSKEVQRRATYNALNAVGRPLRTQVRRLVRDQSGAPYGRVAKAITSKDAHPNNLRYVIKASDKPMPLIDFAKRVKPGQKNVTASPWNKTHTFKNTFVVSFGGQMQVVKRIAKHPRKRQGHKLGVKTVWGPIIPREMLRENEPSLRAIAAAVPDKLVPRLYHELEQAQIRAKAESGT